MASWWEQLWDGAKDTVSKASDTMFGGGEPSQNLKKGRSPRPDLVVQDAGKTPPIKFQQTMPLGLQQASQRGVRFIDGDKQEQKSKEAQQAADWLEGNRAAKSAWFMGSNKDGTNNGWDTKFVDLAEKDFQKHSEAGTLLERGESDDFTGVVTWGVKDSPLVQREGGRTTSLGDIYAAGMKVGNLYEELDEQTANVMLSQWMLSNDEQRRIFASSDYINDVKEGGTSWRLQEAVADRAKASHEDLKKGITASAFKDAVDARQGDENVAWTTIGAAALGGAALGSMAGPLGSVAGAVLGAGAAALNWDSATETTASAFQQVEIAHRDFGMRGAIPQVFSAFGMVGQTALNPLGGAFEGGYNILHGDEWGDGESQFRLDQQEGELSGLAQAGYWGASFASFIPVGGAVIKGVRAGSARQVTNWAPEAYMGTMNASVLGQTAMVGLTGSSFDGGRGEFDNIFVDDEGNYDPSAAAAGIASIGIDAVQANMPAFLRVSSKGATAGGRVQAGGWTVVKDPKTGAIVADSQRRNFASWVAPSERIGAQNTSRLARVNAAKRKGPHDSGAVTAEDFYTAAQQLSMGARPIDTVLLTAFGEGTEEAIQAVLEPISHQSVAYDVANAGISGSEIVQAFLQGSALGGGMAMGSVMRGQRARAAQYEMANAAYKMENGLLQDDAGLSMTEFDELSESEQRRLSTMGSLALHELKVTQDAISSAHTQSLVANVSELGALQHIVNTQLAVEAGKSWDFNPDAVRRGGMYTDPGMPGAQGWISEHSIPEESKSMSLISVLADLSAYQNALQVSLETLSEEIETLQSTEGSLDAKDQLPDMLETQAVLQLLLSQEGDTPSLISRFMEPLGALAGRKDKAAVLGARKWILQAWNGKLDNFDGQPLTSEETAALQYFVSVPTTRYPQDKAGSFQLLVPMPNVELTEKDAHGVALFSTAVLKGFSMDFDGDQSNSLYKFRVGMEAYRSARSGSTFQGFEDSVDIDILHGNESRARALGEAYSGRIDTLYPTPDSMKRGDVPSTLQNYAAETMDAIAQAVRNRIGPMGSSPALSLAIDKFYVGMQSTDPDAAILELLTEISNLPGVIEYSRENLQNVAFLVLADIRAHLNKFQSDFAEFDVVDTPQKNKSRERPSDRPVRKFRASGAPPAATLTGTVTQALPGEDAMRNWMQLHFSSAQSTVEQEAPANFTLQDLTQIYELLSKQESLNDMQALEARGEVQQIVWKQLNSFRQLVTRDNPSVRPDVAVLEFATFTVQHEGRTYSVAQWFLQQAINRIEQKNAQSMAHDPQLRAKIFKLRSMLENTDFARARALLETIGYRPLHEILPDSGTALNRTLTGEQYVRTLVQLQPDARAYQLRVLKQAPANREHRSESHIVKAIETVANNRLTMNLSTGKLSGELADTSNRTSEQLQKSAETLQTLTDKFIRSTNRKMEGPRARAEAIRSYLEQNPAALLKLFEAFPAKAIMTMYDSRTGTIAPWLYDALAHKDPARVEKELWLQSNLAWWRAEVAKMHRDDNKSEHYKGLETRFQRAMYRLAAQPNPLVFQEFITMAEGATNIDTILAWLNKDSGVVTDAPVTAWTDDVAETDADQQSGGWGGSLAGAEQRASIGVLSNAFARMLEDVNGSERILVEDRSVHSELQSELKQVRNGGAPGYRLQQLKETFELSKKRDVIAGPNVTRRYLKGIVSGAAAPRHSKGQAPKPFRHMGAVDVLSGLPGFKPHYGRYVDILTSVDEADLIDKPHLLMQMDMRITTASGAVEEWIAPTSHLDLVEYLDPNHKFYSLVKSALAHTVWDSSSPDIAPTVQSVTDYGMSSILSGGVEGLFAVTSHESLTPAAALMYISELDARQGSHTALIAAQQLGIARTSHAQSGVSGGAADALAVESATNFAEALQRLALYVTQNGGDMSLVEKVGHLLKLRAKQRLRATSSLDYLDSSSKALLGTLEELLGREAHDRETDRLQAIYDAAEASGDNTAAEKAHQALMAHIDSGSATWAESLKRLETGDKVDRIVGLYKPDSQSDGWKARILDFIQDNPQMRTVAVDASQDLAAIASRLLRAERTPGTLIPIPNDTPKGWEKLASVVTGYHLQTVLSPSAPNVNSRSYAFDSRANEAFDYTFSYLYNDLFDSGNGLLKEAVQIQKDAGNHAIYEELSLTELVTKMEKLILGTEAKPKVGEWTEHIVNQTIEANTNLVQAMASDSAVGAAGDSNKAQAAGIAATRWTVTEVPTEEQTAKATFGVSELGLFNHEAATRGTGEVLFQGEEKARPVDLIEVQQKYFTQAQLVAEDGTVLMDLTNSSRTDNDDPNFDNTNFRVWSTKRIRSSILRQGFTQEELQGARVEVNYFDPRNKPSGPEWANNRYFQGVPFDNRGYTQPSLVAAKVMSQGGIPNWMTRDVFDSVKGKSAAWARVMTKAFSNFKNIEATWQDDIYAVIRNKALAVLEAAHGSAEFERQELNPGYYNILFDEFSKRHVVLLDGNPHTVDEVIEWQRTGTMPDNFSEAVLLPLSERALNSLLGEPGTKGLVGVPANFELNLANIPTFRGFKDWTPKQLSRLGDALKGINPLSGSSIIQRAPLRRAMTGAVSEADIDAFSIRVKRQKEISQEVGDYRGRAERGNTSYNRVAENNKVAELIRQHLKEGRVVADISRVGVFSSTARDNDAIAEQAFLKIAQNVEGFLEETKSSRIIIFKHDSAEGPSVGVITESHIDGPLDAHSVVFNDVVDLRLESFLSNGQTEEEALHNLRPVLRHFIDRGATVVLNDTGVQKSALLGAAISMMESDNYQQLPGASRVMKQVDQNTFFRNKAASEGSWDVQETISAQDRMLVFLTNTDGYVDENTLVLLNQRDPSLHQHIRHSVLIRSNFLSQFGIPTRAVTQLGSVMDQETTALRHLGDIVGWDGDTVDTNSAGFKMLRKQEGKQATTMKLEEALTRLLRRDAALPISANEESLKPGDIIPIVDKRGRMVLIRAGHKAPQDIEALLSQSATDDNIATNIAVFSSETEPNSTMRPGQWIDHTFGPNGLQINMRTALAAIGDKLVFEWGGLKYTVVPEIEGTFKIFQGAILGNKGITAVSDLKSADSKAGFRDRADSFSSAWAFFGVNFRENLERAFNLEWPAIHEFLLQLEQSQDHQSGTKELVRANARMLANSNSVEVMESFFGPMQELFSSVNLNWQHFESTTQDSAQETTDKYIALAIMNYLATPGAKLSQVIEVQGLNFKNAEGRQVTSNYLPQNFALAFNGLRPESPIFETLQDEVNNNLPWDAATKTGLFFDRNWDAVSVVNGKQTRGVLALPEVHSSGDSAALDYEGIRPTEKSGLSLHTATAGYAAMGLTPITPKRAEEMVAKIQQEGVPRYETEGSASQMWQDLTRIPWRDDGSFAGALTDSPFEVRYNRLALDAQKDYAQPIEFPDSDPDQIILYQKNRARVAVNYNLEESQAYVVDYWVRQWLGRPAGDSSDGSSDFMPMHQALLALEEIDRNASFGAFPTAGGIGPSTPSAETVEMLYRATHNKANPRWQLRSTLNGEGHVVGNKFEDWIRVGFASAILERDVAFDPMYALATDGLIQTYRLQFGSWMDIPSSYDTAKFVEMFDPNANFVEGSAQDIINKFRSDPNIQLSVEDVAVLDASMSTFSETLSGSTTSKGAGHTLPPADVRAERLKEIQEWRAKNNISTPETKDYVDMVAEGAAYMNNVSLTSNLWKVMQYTRAINGMSNPGLWMSSLGEMASANTRDNIVATMRGTNMSNSPVGKASRAIHSTLGLSPVPTAEELKHFNAMWDAFSHSKSWKKMIFDAITWKQDFGPGGWFTNTARKVSNAAGSLQDATAGLRQKRLARTYLEAVFDEVHMRRGIDNLTIAHLRENATADPLWIEKHHPELHARGLSAVANARHLRQTALSLTVGGIVNSAAVNPRWYINAPANLLKLPLMFSTYGFNVATNLLGLQGLNASILSAIDSNPNARTFLGKTEAWLKGEKYNIDKHGNVDMSIYLEGVDISRAYAQAGVTHTTLAMLGILLGGLSSEDEEERRRRRAARNQHGVMQFDPRSIANDFRNADEWFVDWLPFGLDQYYAVSDGQGGQTSMANPSWIFRQFFSPLKGISDFYNSGNPGDLIAGFEDALLSFPLINHGSWDSAVATHAMLETASQEMNGEGATALSVAKQGGLVSNIVWSYQRMLMENSFVNTLRIHLDNEDRNPWLIPMMEEGEIHREEAYGTPLPSKLTQRYVGDDGNVTVGYKQRDWQEGGLISRAESNVTFALIMSMFTGFNDSPYLRKNMVAQDHIEEMGPTSKEEAEAYVLGRMASFDGDTAASEYDNDTLGGAALSLIDENGIEAVTAEGARAVIKGLWMGTIPASDDPALDGVYITKETRELLQTEWMAELVQEGVDLGLSAKQSAARADRIYWGPLDDPEIKGLSDYLWDRRIPDRADTRYIQLNTTYVMGPDGKPVATGWQRDNLFTALGLAPGTRQYTGVDTGLDTDIRGNTVDPVTGQNLGKRGLVRTEPSWTPPTQEELFDKLAEDIEKALDKLDFSGSRGWGGGWGGGGGGGGYGVRPQVGYTNHPRWNNLRLQVPRMNPYRNDSVKPTFTDNITLRRAETRRQRISSQRGRLKPWQ